MKSLMFPCMFLFAVCSCSSFEKTTDYEHLDNNLDLLTDTALQGIDHLAQYWYHNDFKLQDYLPGVGLRIAAIGPVFSAKVKVAELDLAMGRLLATRTFQDGLYHSTVTFGALSAGENSQGERYSEYTSDLISAKIAPKENDDYFYNVKFNTSILVFQITGNKSLIDSIFFHTNFGPLGLNGYTDYNNQSLEFFEFYGNTGFKGFNFFVNPNEIDRLDFQELNGQIQIHFTQGSQWNKWNAILWLGPVGASYELAGQEITLKALLDLKYIKASFGFHGPSGFLFGCVQVLNVFANFEYDSSLTVIRIRTNYFSYEYQVNKFHVVTGWFLFRGYGFNFKLTDQPNSQFEFKVVLNDKYSIISLPHLDGIEGIGF